MKRVWEYLMMAGLALVAVSAIGAEPFLDWQNLKNPVYRHGDWSIKDSTAAYLNGNFYIFFSAFYFEAGSYRCRVSGVKTRDFKTFSDPLFIWRGEDGGWGGMCSPNLTQIGDTFYLTSNSWGDDPKHPNQLFYAVSKDLEHWDQDKPLAPELTKGKRSIDAAITQANGKYYLVWKENQTPMIAVSGTLEPGKWAGLGPVPGGWFENGEFIEIDGKWYLLATDRAHLPVLRPVRNDSKTDADWLNLGEFVRLKIPLEKFNTVERANCAFLADWRSYDGYFYLLFSGRNRGFGHEGDKYFKLALSRSQDLKTWQAPPK